MKKCSLTKKNLQAIEILMESIYQMEFVFVLFSHSRTSRCFKGCIHWAYKKKVRLKFQTIQKCFALLSYWNHEINWLSKDWSEIFLCLRFTFRSVIVNSLSACSFTLMNWSVCYSLPIVVTLDLMIIWIFLLCLFSVCVDTFFFINLHCSTFVKKTDAMTMYELRTEKKIERNQV